MYGIFTYIYQTNNQPFIVGKQKTITPPLPMGYGKKKPYRFPQFFTGE